VESSDDTDGEGNDGGDLGVQILKRFSSSSTFRQNKLDSRMLVHDQRWVLYSKSDLSSTTKCDQNQISKYFNWITPKARAKHDLLLNKPASVCSAWPVQAQPKKV
jgi:hypothetical protein